MNDKAAFGFSNALVTRSWQTFVNLVKNGSDSVTKISNYLDGLICRIVVNNDDFEHYVDKYYRYWNRLIPNAQLVPPQGWMPL